MVTGKKEKEGGKTKSEKRKVKKTPSYTKATQSDAYANPIPMPPISNLICPKLGSYWPDFWSWSLSLLEPNFTFYSPLENA
jgi:hypothetical protein